jgi:hypothetical protein
VTVPVDASARGYRLAAGSALAFLAGVPAAIGVTSFITHKGEIDWTKAAVGIGFVVLAVFSGVWLILRVKSPPDEPAGQELDDANLATYEGGPDVTYATLTKRLEQLQDGLNDEEDAKEKQRLKDSYIATSAAQGRLRAYVKGAKLHEQIFSRWTGVALVLSVVFAAVGCFLLAVAHKPETAAASTVKVVAVTLTAPQAKTLGCPKTKFTALRVGGTDKQPQVLPLGISCTTGAYLKLNVGASKPTAQQISDVKATATP